VSDSGNNTIRKVIIATGEVTTIAGITAKQGFADGVGGAAIFNNPQGITTDGNSLFVDDFGNNAIRRIK
jgi:hypothetical protein